METIKDEDKEDKHPVGMRNDDQANGYPEKIGEEQNRFSSDFVR